MATNSTRIGARGVQYDPEAASAHPRRLSGNPSLQFLATYFLEAVKSKERTP